MAGNANNPGGTPGQPNRPEKNRPAPNILGRGAPRPGATGSTARAKERAGRINPEYIRSTDRLTWWKRLLSTVAAIACLAWLISGLNFWGLTTAASTSMSALNWIGTGEAGTSSGDKSQPTDAKWNAQGSASVPPGAMVLGATEPENRLLNDAGRLRINHGDVTHAHAAWEANCDACHIPFQPISPNSWANVLFPAALGEGDAKCLSCHPVSAHHNHLATAEDHCATCHREHRGRDADLNLVADSTCIACHKNLGPHIKPADETLVAATAAPPAVTGFGLKTHPPFGGGSDPGRIKFNHALHMAPGMPGRTDGYFRYRDLPPGDKARYLADDSDATDDSLVKLDCASCHEKSRLDGGPAVLGDGRRFLPVTYERHCTACHGIDLDPNAQPGGQQLVTNANVDSIIDLVHGIQPAAIDRTLRRSLAQRLLDTDPTLFDQLEKLRLRSAGRDVPTVTRAMAEARQRLEDSDRMDDPRWGLSRLRRSLFGQDGACTKCHFYETEPGREVAGLWEFPPIEMLTSTRGVANLQVAAANVPAVWYPKALFDHTAHRSIACAACHAIGGDESPAAVPEGDWLNTMEHENLVPGIANCIACHGPAHQGMGGVRNDCGTCHVYHGADHLPLGAYRAAWLKDLHGSQDRLQSVPGE